MDKDKKITSENKVIGKNPKLTNESGIPVSNNQTAMTVGPRGPMAMEDVWYMEKMAHFDREVIPERRMHAKGSGAFGTFKVTNDITKYSKAKIFSEVGKETEIFIRFSTVAGERGAADAERDIRGYAIKFYTEDGNWDLVGNNTPVFFMRDPHHFIGLNRAVKRDPRTNLRSPNNNWDFWTSLPEALHQVTITMSDRGIPKSYRNMHGFSSHAYSMINKDNERFYVKFHMITQQGIENISDEEAEKLVGMDRESHGRDLYEAIEKGNYPKWKMYIQVMTVEQAENMPYNPFDLTKVWYHGEYPLIEVGEYELNRNPENYFADVEQAAFTPANVVPGISFSPDKMLQGRLMVYGDAQRYRLGINHHQIPVNAPKNAATMNSYHRDGQMRVDGNSGSEVHYAPNSYGNFQEQTDAAEPMEKASGDIGRWNFRDDDDDYFTQPGKLFNLMSPEQQKVLVANTRRAMGDTEEHIKLRHIEHCFYADEKYGHMLAEELGIDVDFSKFNVEEYKKRKRTDTSY